MARMYSRKKGKSGSTRPVKKTRPIWVSYSPEETIQLVLKLGRAGKPASQIGLVLRDTYGIPRVKNVTGKSISAILAENKLQPKLPEDLVALIRKGIDIMSHLEGNKKDMPAKRGLQLTESKIRRLTKYYAQREKLPAGWVYDRAKAKFLIE